MGNGDMIVVKGDIEELTTERVAGGLEGIAFHLGGLNRLSGTNVAKGSNIARS